MHLILIAFLFSQQWGKSQNILIIKDFEKEDEYLEMNAHFVKNKTYLQRGSLLLCIQRDIRLIEPGSAAATVQRLVSEENLGSRGLRDLYNQHSLVNSTNKIHTSWPHKHCRVFLMSSPVYVTVQAYTGQLTFLRVP